MTEQPETGLPEGLPTPVETNEEGVEETFGVNESPAPPEVPGDPEGTEEMEAEV